MKTDNNHNEEKIHYDGYMTTKCYKFIGFVGSIIYFIVGALIIALADHKTVLYVYIMPVVFAFAAFQLFFVLFKKKFGKLSKVLLCILNIVPAIIVDDLKDIAFFAKDIKEIAHQVKENKKHSKNLSDKHKDNN